MLATLRRAVSLGIGRGLPPPSGRKLQQFQGVEPADFKKAQCPDPAAVPPVIVPADFEDFAIFRETFLAVFTEPEHNRCLREVGNLIFDMALEYRGYWPDQPEGHIRSELRALVADLRVVEGHLASLGNPEMTTPNSPQEEQHTRVSARLSVEVRGIANVLESELGPWRGEE